MTDLFHEPESATGPPAPEEREGLIPTHITDRNQLNELEEANIAEALSTVFARRRDPLNESFARNLHRRMFNQVWRWAGTYRTTNKNIGPNYWEVQTRLVQVFDDVRYWIEHSTYPLDETAGRFHRDIVWVHPFPNGNGRWSRLMADMLLLYLGGERFTWGGSTLREHDEMRKIYITALRAADNYDYSALLSFARS